MVAGLVFLMAGGPPVAERLGLSTFHFVNRQVLYLAPAVVLILLAVSFLSLRHVRRLALVVYLVGMALVVLRRSSSGRRSRARIAGSWSAGIGIQPSEFVKPAFVVLAAWAFSEGARRKDMPGAFLALLLLPATIVPLILQPDFGQTMLITIVWCGLFFVAGLHWFWVVGPRRRRRRRHRRRLSASCRTCAPASSASWTSHVAATPSRSTPRSEMPSSRGGWFGTGPGEGTVKRILPDAHTDFIFAVTARSSASSSASALLAALRLHRAARACRSPGATRTPFCRLAATGLVLMFGLQAGINMAVNVHLMPAKGMTLPFISYGGSSLLSLALGMGFLMALTRRRPRAEMAGPRSTRVAARPIEPPAASFSRPAGPAGTCSRPRRWPGAEARAASRVALATDERASALCAAAFRPRR